MEDQYNFKTIKMHNKDYVPVNERIKYFRQHHIYSSWSIESEIVELKDTHVVFKCIIKDQDGRVRATGYSHEVKDDGYINKTSYVENAETSAWGRALGCLGIGIETSIASSDEVEMAITKQEAPKPKPQIQKIPEQSLKEMGVEEVSLSKAQLIKGIHTYMEKANPEQIDKITSLSNEYLRINKAENIGQLTDEKLIDLLNGVGDIVDE